MQNQTKGHDRPNFRFSVSALRNLTPLRGEASGNIEVCGHSFEIPLSKVAFISINAYMKLKDDPSAYKIDIQQKDDVNSVYNELTPEILISNFKGIVSIVDGAEASESEFYDQSAISYLSYQLRNVKMFCTTPIPTPHFPLGSPTLNLPFLLASISNLLDQDFAFVVGNYFFRLNKILARFISSAVTKLLSSNSLAREFTIQIPPNIPLEDFVMTFQLITQLLNGEDMEINEANFASVINIAGQLGNASLLFAALSVPEVELQKRLNAAAQFARSSPKAPSEVIDFIADHFGDFQFEELNTLDAETLTSIIKSDCLRVENEDCLLSFCLHIYENDHSKGISILSCVKYEYVSPEIIMQFISTISRSDLTDELWRSICNRLRAKVINGKESLIVHANSDQKPASKNSQVKTEQKKTVSELDAVKSSKETKEAVKQEEIIKEFKPEPISDSPKQVISPSVKKPKYVYDTDPILAKEFMTNSPPSAITIQKPINKKHVRAPPKSVPSSDPQNEYNEGKESELTMATDTNDQRGPESANKSTEISDKMVDFPFNISYYGVIKYLRKMLGAFDQLNKFIWVWCSSFEGKQNYCLNVLDWGSSDEWISREGEKEWIEFDFHECSLLIRGISIIGGEHFFNSKVAITGSNDGSIWEPIGFYDRKDVSPIKSDTATFGFNTSKPYMRFKLTQTNSTRAGEKFVFGLNSIEFYGTLYALPGTSLYRLL